MAARRAKNSRIKKVKKQEDERKKEEQNADEKSLKAGLTGMFERRKTINLDQDQNDNSELMRRLRAWKLAKKAHDEEKF